MIGPRYAVQFRRKRQGKTDYRARLALLRSGLPRFVFRKSGQHCWVQLCVPGQLGDRILASAHSRQLLRFGYKAGLANLPAAYLTGCLAGKRARAAGLSKAILDLGFASAVRGCAGYAAAAGARDAGLDIAIGPVLPSPDRLSGAHIADWAKALGDRAKSAFSNYFRAGLDPSSLPEHFAKIKEAIDA